MKPETAEQQKSREDEIRQWAEAMGLPVSGTVVLAYSEEIDMAPADMRQPLRYLLDRLFHRAHEMGREYAKMEIRRALGCKP